MYRIAFPHTFLDSSLQSSLKVLLVGTSASTPLRNKLVKAIMDGEVDAMMDGCPGIGGVAALDILVPVADDCDTWARNCASQAHVTVNLLSADDTREETTANLAVGQYYYGCGPMVYRQPGHRHPDITVYHPHCDTDDWDSFVKTVLMRIASVAYNL